MATTANPNKELWEKGDFCKIAECMRESGEHFAEELEKLGYFTKGSKVLDLGCGDGTTAFPIAQRGADVLGVDISAPLVAAALKRKQTMGANLKINFREGDACNLAGIPDNSFDLLVTVFGAMFAPKPIDVAKEMVRVVKKNGGRIVMGNWIAGDTTFVASLLKISHKYTPPPPEGFQSPMLWGVEEKVLERFGAAGIPPSAISFEKQMYDFSFPMTASAAVSLFEHFYGPTMSAFAAAKKSGKENELRAELTQMFSEQNTSKRADHMELHGRFQRVTVTL